MTYPTTILISEQLSDTYVRRTLLPACDIDIQRLVKNFIYRELTANPTDRMKNDEKYTC